MEIVELSTRLEGTDTEHYNKAADYWQSVTPTINGMLGEMAILNLSQCQDLVLTLGGEWHINV